MLKKCTLILICCFLLVIPGIGISETADLWVLVGVTPVPDPTETPTPTPSDTPTPLPTETPIPTPTDTPTLTPTPTPSPTSFPSSTPTSTPTPTPGYIDPLIVDNPQAVFTGAWTTGTSASAKYGTDYRFSALGSGENYGIFTPTLPASGQYEIFEWHTQGTNRTTEAQIIIHTASEDTTLTLNQQSNGGLWVSIGTFNLTAGTTCYAKITNKFSTGSVVIADAFKFAYVNTIPSPTPSPTPTASPSPIATPTPTGGMPAFGTFVQQVIDELELKKATDTHGYLMIDVYGKYTGVTDTLWYKNVSYMWNNCASGEAVVSGGTTYYPYGHSYCSGLTLEIFHKAMKKRDAYMGITVANENWNGVGTKGIFVIKKLWNVIKIYYNDTGLVVSNNPSPATALELSGLGKIITYGDSAKFADVKPYDFCDISRNTGSGHSVVFINWIKDASDNITGFRYYSSQSSTEGQGYNTEYFSDTGGTVLRSYFHAGRVYDDPSQNTTNQIREADIHAK